MTINVFLVWLAFVCLCCIFYTLVSKLEISLIFVAAYMWAYMLVYIHPQILFRTLSNLASNSLSEKNEYVKVHFSQLLKMVKHYFFLKTLL